MTQPLKLRILTALTSAFKEITPTNGYVSDLSDFTINTVTTSRVYRGRTWFGEDDPIPMVSVLEGINPGEDVAEPPQDTTSGEYDWAIMVQGFVNNDPLNPTDPAYILLADVRQKLAVERVRKLPNDPTTKDILGLGLRNRLYDLKIGSGVVRPADDISSKAYFWLSLTLRIVDNAATPYA